jgi:hypothetical protein
MVEDVDKEETKLTHDKNEKDTYYEEEKKSPIENDSSIETPDKIDNP